METGEYVWEEMDMKCEGGRVLKRGWVECEGDRCAINITDKLKGGEIYQLILYTYSFLVYR